MGDDTASNDKETALPRKRQNIKSGKIRTAETYVTTWVRWPNEMVYNAQSQPPVYSDMSVALFVNGYLAVVEIEFMPVKEYMMVHLQEMMEDVELYGWRVV